MPEHTVDCWMAAAVIARFPQALIWAPTQQVRDRNWDVAFTHGPGKAMIFENKGARPQSEKNDRHVVDINLRQLRRYRNLGGAPVYYLIPNPRWPSRQTMVADQPLDPVPWAAACRTGDLCVDRHAGVPHDGFDRWSYVISENDLWDYLTKKGPITATAKSRTRLTTDLAFASGLLTLHDFLEGVASCHQGGEPFASVEAAQKWWTSRQGSKSPAAQPESVESTSTAKKLSTGTLAVFVPFPQSAAE